MSALEDELAQLQASHAKRLRDGRDGSGDDDNDDSPPKKRPSLQETKMLVLEVVIQDDESMTPKFYVPKARVPEFLKILINLERDAQVPLVDAVEWAVGLAIGAPTEELLKILAECDIEPKMTKDAWMDRLWPRLKRELKEKFLDFLELDTLQSLSEPPTGNMMVKVTFIIDLDEWER